MRSNENDRWEMVMSLRVEQNFSEAILQKNFSKITFSDLRERNVFLSYIRGFSFLMFDPSVKHIVEIGGGQSTAIFSLMAQSLGCKVSVIDMNPEAIVHKVRNEVLCEMIYRNVEFLRGVSISYDDLESWYGREISNVGGVAMGEVIAAAGEFLDVYLDARKEGAIVGALGINRLVDILSEGRLLHDGRFPQKLLDVFHHNDDEFNFLRSAKDAKGLLAPVLMNGNVDAVFLDSGEFSSLPEWEIVVKNLRVGGYVILHDIFFPKSFKNWLVCAAIRASSQWRVLYVDRSTPQGLMVGVRV